MRNYEQDNPRGGRRERERERDLFLNNRHCAAPSPNRKERTQNLASEEEEKKRRMTDKDSTTDRVAAVEHAPKCFRICGVPSDWSEDDLMEALQDNVDASLKDQHNHELSLYPACCGPTKTALLNLETCSDYFRRFGRFEVKHKQIPKIAKRTEAHLVIDCHFHDLTPLNTLDDEIVAELVTYLIRLNQHLDANVEPM